MLGRRIAFLELLLEPKISTIQHTARAVLQFFVRKDKRRIGKIFEEFFNQGPLTCAIVNHFISCQKMQEGKIDNKIYRAQGKIASLQLKKLWNIPNKSED